MLCNFVTVVEISAFNFVREYRADLDQFSCNLKKISRTIPDVKI